MMRRQLIIRGPEGRPLGSGQYTTPLTIHIKGQDRKPRQMFGFWFSGFRQRLDYQARGKEPNFCMQNQEARVELIYMASWLLDLEYVWSPNGWKLNLQLKSKWNSLQVLGQCFPKSVPHNTNALISLLRVSLSNDLEEYIACTHFYDKCPKSLAVDNAIQFLWSSVSQNYLIPGYFSHITSQYFPQVFHKMCHFILKSPKICVYVCVCVC